MADDMTDTTAADSSSADSSSAEPIPVRDLGYEQARDELAEIVTALEQGSLTLEQSLRLWERGEALAARCEEWLRGARERLEKARRTVTDAESDR